jgi:hypothetical protein
MEVKSSTFKYLRSMKKIIGGYELATPRMKDIAFISKQRLILKLKLIILITCLVYIYFTS